MQKRRFGRLQAEDEGGELGEGCWLGRARACGYGFEILEVVLDLSVHGAAA